MGSGDKIGLFIMPVVVVGYSSILRTQPSSRLVVHRRGWVRSIAVLIAGLAIWIWSVILILANVPSGRLITSGPYAWVKHPLYTAVALPVPWVGFLLKTWLSAGRGGLYLGSRIFAPAEEAELSRTFERAGLQTECEASMAVGAGATRWKAVGQIASH